MSNLTDREAFLKNILLDVDNIDNQGGLANDQAITSSQRQSYEYNTDDSMWALGQTLQTGKKVGTPNFKDGQQVSSQFKQLKNS